MSVRPVSIICLNIILACFAVLIATGLRILLCYHTSQWTCSRSRWPSHLSVLLSASFLLSWILLGSLYIFLLSAARCLLAFSCGLFKEWTEVKREGAGHQQLASTNVATLITCPGSVWRRFGENVCQNPSDDYSYEAIKTGTANLKLSVNLIVD